MLAKASTPKAPSSSARMICCRRVEMEEATVMGWALEGGSVPPPWRARPAILLHPPTGGQPPAQPALAGPGGAAARRLAVGREPRLGGGEPTLEPVVAPPHRPPPH